MEPTNVGPSWKRCEMLTSGTEACLVALPDPVRSKKCGPQPVLEVGPRQECAFRLVSP